MSTSVCDAPPLVRTRVADYVELVKPRIAVLVLVTVAAGGIFAGGPDLNWLVLVHAVVGTALVASGASALNQLLERDTDCLMRRTENRPLPAGRMHPAQVLLFGSMLGIVGTLYLLLTLRQPLAGLLAAFTFLTYVFAYTPLKRYTTLNTLIGAVPGALPPVIGWAAVRGTVDGPILAVFALVFLWQVPHFLAIAWIYREDYGRAGMAMLPVVDRDGAMTARQMVGYCLALLPVSLMPAGMGYAGWAYVVGATLLGIGFLVLAIAFARMRTEARARAVLRASLVYLPLVLALLLLNH